VKSLLDLIALPVRDVWRGLDRSLDRGFPGLGLLAVGLVACWWVYVPIHELLHALGCVATGGSISELEIDGKYGGALLAEIFPFVVSGSEYAGRLSGFDTRGNDLIHLATDFGPYVLTLFPGVWWLRRAARAGRPFWFGASIPVALAPFVSLTGDAYEIGSVLVTRIPPWSGVRPRETLLGDDVFAVGAGLSEAGAGAMEWTGLGLAFGLGAVWAFATYALASRFAASPAEPSRSPPSPGGNRELSAPGRNS